MEWLKRKVTAEKMEPPPQFLAEEKFKFQCEIASAVYNHDIPKELIINLDQTPLSHVSPDKYTFALQGSSNLLIKGVDDKRKSTLQFVLWETFFQCSLSMQGRQNDVYQNKSFRKVLM